MARAHTRTLTKATPTVRTADGSVSNWNFIAKFVDDLNGWERLYDFDMNLPEESTKAPEDFTASDILALIPETYNEIYDAHWHSQHPDPNPPAPVEEVVAEFDLSELKVTANT